MRLRVGYELIFDCPQQTPMLLVLNIHHSRASDIVVPDVLTTNPPVPLTFYRDAFGNWCTRIVAPPGQTRLTASAIVKDSGTFDPRNNVPRIGRILMARGRDATDVAISTAFGPNTLVGFKVWVDEIRQGDTA